MEFNEIIKSRRLKLNKTLEDIAGICKVSKATVQRWESGEIKNVRRDKIANLAIALDTSPEFLLGWNNEVELKEGFSKRLDNALKAKGISQSELVKRTGIGKSTISQYLSGLYIAKQDNISKISKALDVSPAYLMGWDDDEEMLSGVNKKGNIGKNIKKE